VPELPDITIYIEALEARILEQSLEAIRVVSPFLLRTAKPPLGSAVGRRVKMIRRVGKRICIGLEGELWFVLHLMVAGRLHWHPPRQAISRKVGLAAFDFSKGTLLLTEAGTRKRASLHLVEGELAFRAFDPGGLEVLDSKAEDFARILTRENHTLKRALTDPRLFSGIGNAYSDEILHDARLSPVLLTQKLKPEEIVRLHESTRNLLAQWIIRLRQEARGEFPEKVTAFRPEMAVHGKFGESCPRCGATVQRIRYADNETNYCPTCQTNGRLLADRGLSLLLKRDWPRSVEELEELKRNQSL
jgi:formamidopyrimidine-DNA glycosylase